jgi:hypothetical protein
MGSAPILKIVSVHHGDHGVLEPHPVSRLGRLLRLVGIEPPPWVPGLDVAKTTGTGAGFPEHHECRRSVIPTFANIGAFGLLANCKKLAFTEVSLDVEVGLARRDTGLEPFGFADVERLIRHSPGP